MIKGPSNRAASVGDSVQFDCYVELLHVEYISWRFNGRYVYHMHGHSVKYYDGTAKYSVTRSGKLFSLSVKNLTLDDEGIYECSTVSDKKSANLIVLGKSNLITAENLTKNNY